MLKLIYEVYTIAAGSAPDRRAPLAAARWTCPGLAANDSQSSCADLFRVPTSGFQPLQGVDAHGSSPWPEGTQHESLSSGRAKRGPVRRPRRNCKGDFVPVVTARFSPDSDNLRESGDPQASDRNPWVPAFARRFRPHGGGHTVWRLRGYPKPDRPLYPAHQIRKSEQCQLRLVGANAKPRLLATRGVDTVAGKVTSSRAQRSDPVQIASSLRSSQ